MTSLTVLVCDDEPLALDRLADMLGGCADVDVVATVSDGRTALEQIAALKPAIAFLDIEMPGLDGFDIVQRLPHTIDAETSPLIVFVTAHPHFAPQAFDSGAIDFLAKPVRFNRLETTIARARTALADRGAARRLIELQGSLEELRRKRLEGAENDHLWIRRRSEVVRLGFDDIDHIRAEGEYIRLFAASMSYLHRDSITAIAKRLDPDTFMRIHRSVVVRIDTIVAIKRQLHGSIVLRTVSGEELPVGRKYSKAVRAKLLPRLSRDFDAVAEDRDTGQADDIAEKSTRSSS